MFNINTYNKQCEEEFDEKWKETFIKLFGYENPESGRQKRVVAEQAYFNLKKDIIGTPNTTLLRKYLESERERLKQKALEFCGEYNDEKGLRAMVYLEALDDQITHINNLLETLK